MTPPCALNAMPGIKSSGWVHTTSNAATGQPHSFDLTKMRWLTIDNDSDGLHRCVRQWCNSDDFLFGDHADRCAHLVVHDLHCMFDHLVGVRHLRRLRLKGGTVGTGAGGREGGCRRFIAAAAAATTAAFSSARRLAGLCGGSCARRREACCAQE